MGNSPPVAAGFQPALLRPLPYGRGTDWFESVPHPGHFAVRIAVTVLLALLTGRPGLAREERHSPVKIGVQVKRNTERCLEKWNPTAQYLTDQVPGHAFVIVPLGFEEVCPAVECGEVDFALANPGLYVEIEARYGAMRLVTLKNLRLGTGCTEFGGVIFRRSDRHNLKHLIDLKGKTFMAPSERSLVAWLAVWRELKEAGVDPYGDFADLRFGGSHDAVVDAVRAGKVDAGSVRTDTLERMAMEGKIVLEDFRVFHEHGGKEAHLPFLHSTRAYPEWPFAKVKHTSNELAQEVTIALLGMPPGSAVAQAAKCVGWTVPLNYQPVHEGLKELRIGPYKDFGKVAIGDVLRQYWLWIASFVVLLGSMVVTVLWALRSLSRRKRAEKMLRESEHRHRAITESAQDAIIASDARGNIRFWNSAAEKIFGFAAAEAVGKNMMGLIAPPQYHHAMRQGLDKFAHPGSGAAVGNTLELTALRKDGTEFPIEISISQYRDQDGFVAMAVVRDITDRKQVEHELHNSNARMGEALKREKCASMQLEAAMQQLKAATQEAQAATRAKSLFLANMSHEIRTPMTAILGFADVLLENGNLDKAPLERIEAAHTIKRNGEYLIRIINDILDLSKIEAGKMIIERISCSPCRIIDEVASLVRMRAEAKGLSLGIECLGSIPETVHTDPTRLRQILLNLIDNAIKFTSSGGIRLITSLVKDSGSETFEPCLQFDVVDTGVGIPADQISTLFEPFTQADSSTTRKFGGTGLGLTISKQLARLLGGDIEMVESQPSVGTRFRLTVSTGPLKGVKMVTEPFSTSAPAPEAPSPAAGAEQTNLHNCRVLLAEDGLDNQRLIAHVLKKAGAEVTVVENGKLAVDAALEERAAGNPFDVILMDMQMPVMDGYEATRLLRSQGYTSPIIALTAHAMAGDQEKCINAGCDAYATKPIDRKKLLQLIRTHTNAVSTTV
ncbi:MAG: PhnD/SsuA/transferrin family substrate-binding protein [Phycisphaerae bacterium]|nr:PhnD/SsuA/transferrin family substrate-binding protein [Phycisphaerae bacterium]